MLVVDPLGAGDALIARFVTTVRRREVKITAEQGLGASVTWCECSSTRLPPCHATVVLGGRVLR
jgi:hypothetical protein